MLWINMGVGGALRQLAAFLEECEQTGMVEAVELVECNDSPDGGLSADVELTLHSPAGESMSPCAATLNADGTVRVGFETDSPVVPSTDHDVDVEPAGAKLDEDGRVQVVLSAAVGETGESVTESLPSETPTEPLREADPSSSQTTTPDASDRDLPPFKNPELLQSVYDSCDTFEEMADALEMDVTAETVRRYMIDFDIHEPNSYDTSEESGREEEPVVLSDGIGLPDDITVDTLIETVKQSNTIYEVKRDMGVDREDALEMLRELNLLDLVVGRLATEAERDISRDDIVDRLREASATQ